MKKGHRILTLTLSLCAASVAWAQSDEPQQPAPSPAPAFGQENPAPTVSENPPISAIDQPGLEPHAAPESFLMPGLHFSESVDSNVANTLGGSSLGTVTRGLGSLTLQKLWKNYDVALDYIGGVAYYTSSGYGLQQLQQFDIDNRINWKRGQLAIRDSFGYLPEGTFDGGAYGGSGAYNSSFGSLGAGMLGAGAFGLESSVFNGGSNLSLGEVPRLTNLGLVDVVEELTPKSAVTIAAGYAIEHFYEGIISTVTGEEENTSFLGSREYITQAAYDRILSPRNQVALSYGHQAFDFSIAGTAFHSNVIQAMYGHRISGRMNFTIAAGPQFTHIDAQATVCSLGSDVPSSLCSIFGGTFVNVLQTANRIGAAGRLLLSYKFPKTYLNLTFQRYDASGAGIFAGSLSNVARLDVQRPLTRVWNVFSDIGYSKNDQLQLAGSTLGGRAFTSGFAGVGLHRQFGRSLRGFVSYQFNDFFTNASCPLPGSLSTAPCSNTSRRQVGSIGVDWAPRPIRLD
jgi:hypothetical protein